MLALDSNYYFGLSAGPSQARTDGRVIVDGQLPAGVTSSGLSVDRRDTAYRAFLGYQMTPFWALEGGYFRLGACRTWGVEAKFGPNEDSFRRICSPIAVAMGQKTGEKWTAAAKLQPTFPKPDRLLVAQVPLVEQTGTQGVALLRVAGHPRRSGVRGAALHRNDQIPIRTTPLPDAAGARRPTPEAGQPRKTPPLQSKGGVCSWRQPSNG